MSLFSSVALKLAMSADENAGNACVLCVDGSEVASSKISILPSNMLPSVAFAVNGRSGEASLAASGMAMLPRGLPVLVLTADRARSQKALL